jgi:hypothetical protein
MSKSPILNALAGLCYIATVAFLLFYGQTFVHGMDNTIFMPIAVLSLFVFSAASMGYIFMYHPLMLFLEGEKKGAADLFLKTLFAFAGSVVVFVLIGLYLTAYF